MSQTSNDVRAPSNPTSACASCHRRKLKCDRVAEGCYNCTKAQVACLYPPRERAPRRKRGPYFKDRTKREQELKHTLKTLEVKLEKLTNHLESHGMHFNDNVDDNDPKPDSNQAETFPNPEDSFERATRGSSVASIDHGERDPILSSPAIRDDRLCPRNRFWSNFTTEVSWSLVSYECPTNRTKSHRFMIWRSSSRNRKMTMNAISRRVPPVRLQCQIHTIPNSYLDSIHK